jgi:hypothetical protein
MELGFRDRFIGLWGKYFDGAEHPITFYYTDQEGRGELVHATSSGHQCFLGVLGKVWKGQGPPSRYPWNVRRFSTPIRAKRHTQFFRTNEQV